MLFRLCWAFAILLFASGVHAQTALTTQQISAAEALGRKIDIPLKLGTLIQSAKGDGFQAFITTPEQRIAYAVSDMNPNHGSGAKDPLANELHLNRLRVTGLPYPTRGQTQHNSRHVLLCDKNDRECIKPAHEVLDVNQVVAEFEMPVVLKMAGADATFIVKIQNDVGVFQPPMSVPLASLKKSW